MTKQFCDICGGLAIDRNVLNKAEAKHPYGGVREDEEYNQFQPVINIKAVFTFRNHPTGFGGPPDLCNNCIAKLLWDLAKTWNPQMTEPAIKIATPENHPSR